ncbi:MAG: hypothetical protein KDD48_00395 [Bdellovibrionales bacterium]|nr:hypothetical protein [Bdellovibrionales bacterium]
MKTIKNKHTINKPLWLNIFIIGIIALQAACGQNCPGAKDCTGTDELSGVKIALDYTGSFSEPANACSMYSSNIGVTTPDGKNYSQGDQYLTAAESSEIGAFFSDLPDVVNSTEEVYLFITALETASPNKTVNFQFTEGRHGRVLGTKSIAVTCKS